MATEVTIEHTHGKTRFYSHAGGADTWASIDKELNERGYIVTKNETTRQMEIIGADVFRSGVVRLIHITLMPGHGLLIG
jgi:hypothetical protein